MTAMFQLEFRNCSTIKIFRAVDERLGEPFRLSFDQDPDSRFFLKGTAGFDLTISWEIHGDSLRLRFPFVRKEAINGYEFSCASATMPVRETEVLGTDNMTNRVNSLMQTLEQINRIFAELSSKSFEEPAPAPSA